MSASAVERALHLARIARRERRPGAVLDALATASQALDQLDDRAGDHPLPVVVAWKRAKAEYDFGRPEQVVRHLDGVVDRADLFDAWPPGVLGAEQVARAHQDTVGYGDPTVIALWERLSTFHRDHGDRYRSARAALELAWDAACRGLPTTPFLQPLASLLPSDLKGGPSWHPDAADAASSLPWLTLDAAHTGLRAAIWSGDVHEIPHALDDLQHALDELPGQPGAYLWTALAEAHHHGVGPPVSAPATSGFEAAWLAALSTGQGFETAAQQASGPEWALAVRLCAVVSGVEALEDLEDDARASGCLAFVRPR